MKGTDELRQSEMEDRITSNGKRNFTRYELMGRNIFGVCVSMSLRAAYLHTIMDELLKNKLIDYPAFFSWLRVRLWFAFQFKRNQRQNRMGKKNKRRIERAKRLFCLRSNNIDFTCKNNFYIFRCRRGLTFRVLNKLRLFPVLVTQTNR